jgi:hypothetical protein
MRSPAMYEIVGSGVGCRVGTGVGEGLGDGEGDGEAVGGAVVTATVGVAVGVGDATLTLGSEAISATTTTISSVRGASAIASCRVVSRCISISLTTGLRLQSLVPIQV